VLIGTAEAVPLSKTAFHHLLVRLLCGGVDIGFLARLHRSLDLGLLLVDQVLALLDVLGPLGAALVDGFPGLPLAFLDQVRGLLPALLDVLRSLFLGLARAVQQVLAGLFAGLRRI